MTASNASSIKVWYSKIFPLSTTNFLKIAPAVPTHNVTFLQLYQGFTKENTPPLIATTLPALCISTHELLSARN